MSSLVVDRCEGSEGLQQISAAWEALADRLERPHFNQMPAWYHAYFRALAPARDKVQFFSVHRDDRLVAVAPLMRDPRSGVVRRMTLANDRGIYTTDLVIAPEESPGAIWRALERATRRDRRFGWDVFQAGHGGTMQSSCMRRVARGFGRRAVEKPAREGYMVIDVGPYAEVVGALSGNFRRTLKRSRRRLDELGEVQFRWVHDPAEVRVAFDRFVALEKSGWKGTRQSGKAGYPRPDAIGLHEWKHDFYRELLVGFASRGAVDFLLLEAGEALIGSQISLQIGPTNYALKTAMDESIRGVSTGHMMIDALLRLLDERGDADQVNLLTDYSWPEPWTPRCLQYVDTWIYNRTPLGLLAMLRQRLRS